MKRETARPRHPNHPALRNAHTERFERFVQRHGRSRALRLFTRANDEGRARHYVQVPAGKMPAFLASFGLRQRIVGLFSVRHPHADHLFLRLGVRSYDIEYPVAGEDGYWTMNGERFRQSSSMLTERLVQLTNFELARLRSLVAGFEAQMRRSGGRLDFSGNCVDVWMSARIGRNGKTFSQVIGIEEEEYGPEVMNQILDSGNERVLGAAIYPPRGKEFRSFERIRERFPPAPPGHVPSRDGS